MGLVEYGSDSDSDSDTPTSVPVKSTSNPLNLPAPKSSTNSLKAAAPKRKKILLDLPPPSSSSAVPVSATQDTAEPPAKRPKLALGSGAGASGGLASLLPKPKHEADVVKKTEKAIAEAKKAGPSSIGMFLPKTVAKAKIAQDPVPSVEETTPVEPEVDFFGLGTVSSAPTLPTLPSSSKTNGISSAPTVARPPSSPRASTYGDAPTADDPYPGFVQLPSGEWVAKDQKTYDAMLAAQSSSSAAVPRGFGGPGGGSGMTEVNAEKERAEWDRLQKARKKLQPDKVPEQENKKVKQVSAAARGRHQLSSLLADAHNNRAELEERIAQARINRKSAGSKYGF